MALETAGTGITCNAVGPATLPTDAIYSRIDAMAAAKGLSREEAVREYMKERQPSGRFVELADVAAMIVFLCGPRGPRHYGHGDPDGWRLVGGLASLHGCLANLYASLLGMYFPITHLYRCRVQS
ncbi:MAG: SDR family oxidoreductase [Bradyrhizobium sp.]